MWTAVGPYNSIRIGWGNEWWEINHSDKNFAALTEELDSLRGTARHVIARRAMRTRRAGRR